MRPLALLLLLHPAVALAEESMSADVELEREESRRNWVNFRVGASSGNKSGRPNLCLEGTPFPFVSVEASGTRSTKTLPASASPMRATKESRPRGPSSRGTSA